MEPEKSTKESRRGLAGRFCELALVVALAAAPSAHAMAGGVSLEPGWVHHRWTVEDGLPVNALGQILQASDGYLWIGTYDGLVRFDGARFTVLRTDTVPELGSNRVIGLEETHDGMWILTEPSTLSRYRDGAFELIKDSVGGRFGSKTMNLDAAGMLWVGAADTVYRAGPNGLEEIGFRLPEKVILRLFAHDEEGVLWLATSAGIASFADGQLSWVHPATHVEAILVDGDRLLFFRKDIAPLEVRAGQWRALSEEVLPGVSWRGAVSVTPRRWGGHLVLTDGRLLGVEKGVIEDLATVSGFNQVINWTALGPDGSRWWAAGNRLNRNNKTVLTLETGVSIVSLALDFEGTVWLTTTNAGLHALRPGIVGVYGQAEGLPNENVYSVYEDPREGLWIGTHGGGLWHLDQGQLRDVPKRQGKPRTSFPRAMVEDAAGTLWVGLMGGLYRVDDDELVPVGGSEKPIIADHVTALLIDRRQQLWVGTIAGLHQRIGPSRKTGAAEWRRMDPARLPHADIRTLAEDADGGLWVATAGGLARLEEGYTQIVDRSSGLPSNLVRALHIDERGIVWIGTENGGLARLDPASLDQPGGPEVFCFGTTQGLFSNGIHHILADDLGHLWMSSNQGLFRVRRSQLESLVGGDISRVESVGYTEREGLRNREANGGSRNSGLRSRDGRLWFATQAGLAVIDPATVAQEVATTPPARIEGLRVSEEPRPFAQEGLILPAHERTFSIEYTAITSRAANQTRFRYRLRGYDETWIEAGQRRAAFFTRVPAGSYTFMVESKITGQDWDGSTVASRSLTIEPLFHEHWWFRPLGTAGVLVVFLAALRWQTRRQAVLRQRLEQLVAERTTVIARQADKLRELDRLKSDLFTNVSHEFRTPLTLTIGPLTDLLEGARGPLADGVHEDVELALRNSRRVLGLINQILDVARLEAGQVRLRVELLDLAPWLQNRVDLHRPLAERNGVELIVDPMPAHSAALVDPVQMAKVIDNLMANALKLTPTGGSVRWTLSSIGEWHRIAVRDTGPGIPATELPRIFDRFHQVDVGSANGEGGFGRPNWSGTGIGLALAKEVVDLHHGTLDVESVEGQGAAFIISLRVGKDHFIDDGLVDDSAVIDRPTSGAASPPPPTSLSPTSLSPTNLSPTSLSPTSPSPTSLSPTQSAAGITDQAEAENDLPSVLVVDDEPEIRRYVRGQLSPDFRVVEAADGVEALRSARNRVPDLIVADVMMPNMDGYTLARQLKADPELEFVPLILLTAKASTTSRLEGLGEGIDDYLTKPFDARELRSRVHNLIEGRRRLRNRYAVEDGPVLRLPSVDLMPADQAFLERVRDLIAENLDDPDFKVESLATALGCDRTYLFRKLRELLDETPSAVLRELRLARAEQLLASGVGSVAEVAYAVGFKSVSHFTHRFRQRYGSTPSAYAAQGDTSYS